PLELVVVYISFFFNHPAYSAIFTLSLHDALPISAVAIEDELVGSPDLLGHGGVLGELLRSLLHFFLRRRHLVPPVTGKWCVVFPATVVTDRRPLRFLVRGRAQREPRRARGIAPLSSGSIRDAGGAATLRGCPACACSSMGLSSAAFVITRSSRAWSASGRSPRRPAIV